MRQNVGGCIALPVVVFEILGDDYALGVQNEGARIRDAKKWLVLRDRFVQQTQFPNDLRIRVRQQWIMDSPALGKAAQYRHAVITDGCYSQTEFVELTLVAFQLHELGFAEWSPVGRAVKQNHRSLRTQQAVQPVRHACLIGQFKRRKRRADCRPVFSSAHTTASDEENGASNADSDFRHTSCYLNAPGAGLHRGVAW